MSIKKTYRLFGIEVGKFLIISRGETEEQAIEYCADRVLRGHGYTVLTSLPVDAAKEYSVNHEDGWLHREPAWVKKSKEAGKAIYSW